MATANSKLSIVKGTLPPVQKVPSSNGEWKAFDEANDTIRRAIEKTMKSLAALDESRIVPQESLNRPMSTF